MTTQEVADKYYELYQQGNPMKVQDELYSPDVVCNEPEHAAPFGIPTRTEGIEAITAKALARQASIAGIKDRYCSKPVVAGDFFSVGMSQEVTFKNGMVRKLAEIAVFQVKDDKIISETFFF